MQALIGLLRLDKTETVLLNLDLRLRSEDPQVRLAALEAVGDIAPSWQVSLDVNPIIDALEDPSASIRRAAVLALGNTRGEFICKTLLKYLSDVDGGVRSAAAQVLRARSDESRAHVLDIIKSQNRSIDAALDALAPGDPKSLAPLRAYAERELLRARTLRKQAASIPSSGKATAFLGNTLRMQAALSEGRLVKTVGLFGDTHTMELVRKSLRGTNVENRPQH